MWTGFHTFHTPICFMRKSQKTSEYNMVYFVVNLCFCNFAHIFI
ncbi:hypothetical protein HMPREF0673_02481 [Leyella stercorea DSM 18206]|uniref:Uncharacterized protein n=1 Tax=Leyella stercorea DSM 18206 TaxID=1002367 RepID=G6B0R3_9BACT|nr:hypothetical protein HMPREF0673_02481 [Leyella stercorea DSM 18206]